MVSFHDQEDKMNLLNFRVSRHLACYLAPSYALMELITVCSLPLNLFVQTYLQALARAHPDPNVAYRKSQRSQQASEEIARTSRPVPSLAAPVANEPVLKRQRQESPVRASNTDERHITVEATTTITGPSSVRTDMEAEIAQAKQMVVDLRRELQLKAATGQDLEDQGVDVPADRRGKKRAQDDDDEGVTISGGVGPKTERIIRKNKKVETGNDTGRKIAWGAVMFGLGIGAASYVPLSLCSPNKADISGSSRKLLPSSSRTWRKAPTQGAPFTVR